MHWPPGPGAIETELLLPLGHEPGEAEPPALPGLCD